MESLLKADIFFFVTTVTIALVGVLLVCILIYVIKILRNIKSLSDDVMREGKKIVQDVGAAHAIIKDKAKFASTLIKSVVPKKKKSTKKN